jgi:hypothetical protein
VVRAFFNAIAPCNRPQYIITLKALLVRVIFLFPLGFIPTLIVTVASRKEIDGMLQLAALSVPFQFLAALLIGAEPILTDVVLPSLVVGALWAAQSAPVEGENRLQ